MQRTAIIAAVTCCGLAVGAHADTITWEFPLSGDQEVPPVITPASGEGIVTLNTATNELEWEIAFRDIATNVVGAHFHGPADFGENAGITLDLEPFSGLESPLTGSTTISATDRDQILDGLWYVNVHSEAHPPGEIRGQVVPAPAGAAALALVGFGLTMRRRRG